MNRSDPEHHSVTAEDEAEEFEAFAAAHLREAETTDTAIDDACATVDEAIRVLDGLRAENALLRREIETRSDDSDLIRELLDDLWFCHCEQHAIGGGPGWKEREQAAWARVAEHYEP